MPSLLLFYFNQSILLAFAEVLDCKYTETMKTFENKDQKINSHVATSFFLSERETEIFFTVLEKSV